MNRKLNVWYVFMRFPAPSETFACGDIKSLVRQDINISAFALRKKQKVVDKLIVERGLTDLAISHTNVKSIFKGLIQFFLQPVVAFNLLRWIFVVNRAKPKDLALSLILVPRVLEVFSLIQHRRPDVVHLFWGHYPSMVGFLVEKYCKNVVLSMFLGAYDLESKYSGSGFMLPKADVVWTHAKYNIDLINALAKRPVDIDVVYRGFDFSAVSKHKIDKSHRKVVAVGNLIESKGVDDSIRVFKSVLQKYPDANLTICGDGPKRQDLETLCKQLGIEKSVFFLGHVSHAEVLRQLSSAELLIFMSRKQSDRLPNVLKEAMALRTICVTTETPGIRELVPDDLHGYVTAMGNVASAADYAIRVLAKDFDTETVVNNAYTHLKTFFDIDKCMRCYKTKWQSLSAAKKQVGEN